MLNFGGVAVALFRLISPLHGLEEYLHGFAMQRFREVICQTRFWDLGGASAQIPQEDT